MKVFITSLLYVTRVFVSEQVKASSFCSALGRWTTKKESPPRESSFPIVLSVCEDCVRRSAGFENDNSSAISMDWIF